MVSPCVVLYLHATSHRFYEIQDRWIEKTKDEGLVAQIGSKKEVELLPLTHSSNNLRFGIYPDQRRGIYFSIGLNGGGGGAKRERATRLRVSKCPFFMPIALMPDNSDIPPTLFLL